MARVAASLQRNDMPRAAGDFTDLHPECTVCQDVSVQVAAAVGPIERCDASVRSDERNRGSRLDDSAKSVSKDGAA